MLAEIFAAADQQVRAAGGLLAGGHTIRDAEPKYGLAVVGTVHPDGIWPKNGARPGDALFLTKPLGTGLIMSGYKRRLAGQMQLERAVRWMRTLNKDAAEVLRRVEPNAVTDVTGFGLFGHAYEVADRSRVSLRLESERFPAIDGALDLVRKGVRTSGDPRNRDDGGPKLMEHFLVARRLVEAGARCVTLAFSRWDHHGDNFGALRQDLPLLDQGLSALIEDIHQRGLDKDVSVVVWGEFGRTPTINKDAGRDHWPRVSCALLAGGGMKTGQVIGATDRLGGEAIERPVQFGDVFATLYHCLGIDINKVTVTDLTGRPQHLVDAGCQPLREVI